MAGSRKWLRRIALITAALVVLGAGVGWVVTRLEPRKQVTAYFTAAVGVYPGSDVRVLGVKVGTIDAVEPQGQTVRVSMRLDPDIAIPASAKALVVTPSLVSDRYVQLTPAYTAGPMLDGGATIPVTDTAVPVELDELFASLDRLTTALGPDGANKDGALSDLLDSSAKMLDGNGKKLSESIKGLGESTRTLSGSQDDLFATIDSVQKFTTMLHANDALVGKLNDQLAEVSGFLAGEREEFGAAMHELAGALSIVETFIKDNRGRIKTSVEKLQGTAQLLSDQRASLAEALDAAPLALTNLLAAYDPATGTIDGRGNLTEFVGANPPLPLVGG
ncbi:MCE family protein [Actinokineospora sp. HUAS TT18]|uniref:MCE family protein n=1 Tax=Actinokineospora sp. HUAS TT18 TaxID=3447451 RepID=UPI003F52644E